VKVKHSFFPRTTNARASKIERMHAQMQISKFTKFAHFHHIHMYTIFLHNVQFYHM